jgi:pimeloyl-ACP methyl ester carboxylesterase
MCGTADLITPPAESRRLASTIPGARLEMFEGAGHMLMLERTDEVDRLIVDFARDMDGRGHRSEAAGSAG